MHACTHSGLGSFAGPEIWFNVTFHWSYYLLRFTPTKASPNSIVLVFILEKIFEFLPNNLAHCLWSITEHQALLNLEVYSSCRVWCRFAVVFTSQLACLRHRSPSAVSSRVKLLLSGIFCGSCSISKYVFFCIHISISTLSKARKWESGKLKLLTVLTRRFNYSRFQMTEEQIAFKMGPYCKGCLQSILAAENIQAKSVFLEWVEI